MTLDMRLRRLELSQQAPDCLTCAAPTIIRFYTPGDRICSIKGGEEGPRQGWRGVCGRVGGERRDDARTRDAR